MARPSPSAAPCCLASGPSAQQRWGYWRTCAPLCPSPRCPPHRPFSPDAAHSASYVVWGTSAGSLGRVIGTVSGSTTAMMAYGHYAGDVITRRAVLAVALGELVGTLVVLYMEHCCRGRVDWLLMALLPNVPPLTPSKAPPPEPQPPRADTSGLFLRPSPSWCTLGCAISACS